MALPPDTETTNHRQARATSSRLPWLVFGAALVLAVVAGLFVDFKSHFGIEGSFGFFAWFGFLACVAMIILAKLLGILIKRPEDYYDRR